MATLGPKAPVPGRRGGRRQGCGLPVPAFDASLQAAQASPEGWEKLPERLGRTSDSWGQPSPPRRRAVLPRTVVAAAGALRRDPRGRRRRSENSTAWLQTRPSQRPGRPAGAEGPRARGGGAGRSAQARTEAGSPGHPSFSVLPGFRGGRQAPLGPSAHGCAPPFAPGTQSPLTLPGPGPSARPEA